MAGLAGLKSTCSKSRPRGSTGMAVAAIDRSQPSHHCIFFSTIFAVFSTPNHLFSTSYQPVANYTPQNFLYLPYSTPIYIAYTFLGCMNCLCNWPIPLIPAHQPSHPVHHPTPTLLATRPPPGPTQPDIPPSPCPTLPVIPPPLGQPPHQAHPALHPTPNWPHPASSSSLGPSV